MTWKAEKTAPLFQQRRNTERDSINNAGKNPCGCLLATSRERPILSHVTTPLHDGSSAPTLGWYERRIFPGLMLVQPTSEQFFIQCLGCMLVDSN
ncbi:hypothetical protein TNIN_139511 [Trichonephila inaurata madagascariensis]|uniref:Uncharacterized protein n=1 Tax=Trichonephila inaurata madagascariensis TaxID=2747483 RepID=A0A8X6YSI6_9ARAC|nr:hypothetical protein TNIN_139511 [Trichonephila inaurata madagascariensis]